MIPVLSKIQQFWQKFGLELKHSHKHHTYQLVMVDCYHKTSKITYGIEKFTFSLQLIQERLLNYPTNLAVWIVIFSIHLEWAVITITTPIQYTYKFPRHKI